MSDTDLAGCSGVPFWADTVPVSAAAVVLVCGEIDLATVDRFAGAVEAAFALDRPLVVDLSRVTFFAAAGIAVLVRAGSRAGYRGQLLRVVHHRQHPGLRLLSRFGNGWAVFDDVEQALNAHAPTDASDTGASDTRPSRLGRSTATSTTPAGSGLSVAVVPPTGRAARTSARHSIARDERAIPCDIVDIRR